MFVEEIGQSRVIYGSRDSRRSDRDERGDQEREEKKLRSVDGINACE